MGSATVEEFVELLNAEQHVDLQKLRDLARHGVQPAVRGEVWLYLLGVLSDDKGQEMTSVRSKYLEYEALDKHNPALEKRVRSECQRYYQKRLGTRPPPGRTLMRSSRSVAARRPGGYSGGIGSAGTGTSDGPGAGSTLGGAVAAMGSPHSVMPAVGTAGVATATLLGADRGPNRVNDGRIHALGGIIGESGVSAAMDADDPDAAAALELKRFGRSVESIVCAFMNRCAAAEAARRRAADAINAAAPAIYEPETSTSQTATHASEASNDERRQVEYSPWGDDTSRCTEAGEGGNGAASTRSNGSRTRHTHSGGSSSRSRSRAGSMSGGSNAAGGGGRDKASVEESVRSRMPREYEWEPQITTAAGGRAGTASEFHPALVYLCAPFVQCVRVEAGMYFAFEKLMTLMARHSARHPLPRQVATFLTLFRTTLPELHSYFEEEEVDIIGFATNWLQHLLAGELRIEDLMRLWDTYFALPDFMDLHLYVCIAILTNCKDSLEELDRSETRSMLDSLPPLDVDRIINEAINIRLSHQRSQRTDEL